MSANRDALDACETYEQWSTMADQINASLSYGDAPHWTQGLGRDDDVSGWF